MVYRLSELCNSRRAAGGLLACSANALVSQKSSAQRCARPVSNVPCLLSFFALQVHGHHSPGQILHSFLIWQLGLGLAIKPPYLRSKRVLFLHFIGIAKVGAGGVVLPIRKKAFAEKVFSSLLVFWGDVQFVSNLSVGRRGWSMSVVR